MREGWSASVEGVVVGRVDIVKEKEVGDGSLGIEFVVPVVSRPVSPGYPRSSDLITTRSPSVHGALNDILDVFINNIDARVLLVYLLSVELSVVSCKANESQQ